MVLHLITRWFPAVALLSLVSNAGTFYSVLLIPFRGGTTGLTRGTMAPVEITESIDECYTTRPPLIPVPVLFPTAGKTGGKRISLVRLSSLIATVVGYFTDSPPDNWWSNSFKLILQCYPLLFPLVTRTAFYGLLWRYCANYSFG